jgi:NHL repeat
VEKFDSNGNYLTQWDSNGSSNGQFEQPLGVAVNSTGNFIYVADAGNSRIEVFANNPNIVPPILTSQPASQTVLAGANVTFTVSVVGTAPFAYQWNFNNVAVAGATNATLILTNVSLAGNYSVLVTNSFGSELSSYAVLTVLTAIIMTQPASSVTTTGAVLNGSVTVGSDETVVWFEWGTDTNYGNIADETIVPGNSGSNNISTVLNGLPGNIYHYRIDAANDSGIVYGNDVSFTVGFAPTAMTLAALNSPNGSTLNATVNPRGWDTTVYFKWGAFGGLLTNLTPIMDVGAGAVPLNVSSFITGLTPFQQYSCQAVASNHLGNVTGAQVTFYSPPFVTVPGEDWTSLAASADGSVMIAVANPGSVPPPLRGPIYISTNSGAVWTRATNAPLGTWQSVACSADGSKIIAAEGGAGGSILGSIYTSTDTGTTWMSNNTPVTGWQSVASSADGTKLVAADLSANLIFTSTNAGATWMRPTQAPRLGWYSIASSADGSKLAAVANGSTNIYTSTNFGATWITNNVPRSPAGIQNDWTTIASSADGNKLIAAAGGNNGAPGYIFLSTNSGASWTVTATNILPSHGDDKWIYVASSADGSKLAAVSESGSPGGVITSTDSGATWITNSVPNLTWNAVALSADGDRMVVTVGYPSYVGPIYTTQTTRSPVLNLSASDNVLSWIIPSLDFTLQQSPDLLNWTDLTNPPVLNLTNLQNQVTLPPPDGNSFFRLIH